MAKETETFGVNVTLSMNGSFQTLLTGAFSYLNADLADVYGVSGVTGDDLQLVQLAPTVRAGLLTQPGLQALSSVSTRNSPPTRGTYIRERFLCVQIPPPPPGVPELAPDPPTGQTLRKALEAHVRDATCAACHQLLDPPGLAFEGFDAIGRARATDNGAPVDVSNLDIVELGPGGDMIVNGPIELADLISSNASAEDCMTRQWLSFVLGRALQDADTPWVTQIDNTFSAAGFNLKELIAAVLLSGPFLSP